MQPRAVLTLQLPIDLVSRACRGASGAAAKPLPNLPVTFHRKVKSSGYGMVQPPVRLGHAKPAPVRVTKPAPPSALLARHVASMRQYPLDCAPPAAPQPQHALPGNAPLHSGAIVRLAFSGEASR